MAVVVSGHLATEHKIVFRIALSLFPNFTLPFNPKASKSNLVPVTIEEVDDDECVVVLSGPPVYWRGEDQQHRDRDIGRNHREENNVLLLV